MRSTAQGHGSAGQSPEPGANPGPWRLEAQRVGSCMAVGSSYGTVAAAGGSGAGSHAGSPTYRAAAAAAAPSERLSGGRERVGSGRRAASLQIVDADADGVHLGDPQRSPRSSQATAVLAGHGAGNLDSRHSRHSSGAGEVHTSASSSRRATAELVTQLTGASQIGDGPLLRAASSPQVLRQQEHARQREGGGAARRSPYTDTFPTLATAAAAAAAGRLPAQLLQQRALQGPVRRGSASPSPTPSASSGGSSRSSSPTWQGRQALQLQPILVSPRRQSPRSANTAFAGPSGAGSRPIPHAADMLQGAPSAGACAACGHSPRGELMGHPTSLPSSRLPSRELSAVSSSLPSMRSSLHSARTPHSGPPTGQRAAAADACGPAGGVQEPAGGRGVAGPVLRSTAAAVLAAGSSSSQAAAHGWGKPPSPRGAAAGGPACQSPACGGRDSPHSVNRQARGPGLAAGPPGLPSAAELDYYYDWAAEHMQGSDGSDDDSADSEALASPLAVRKGSLLGPKLGPKLGPMEDIPEMRSLEGRQSPPRSARGNGAGSGRRSRR